VCFVESFCRYQVGFPVSHSVKLTNPCLLPLDIVTTVSGCNFHVTSSISPLEPKESRDFVVQYCPQKGNVIEYIDDFIFKIYLQKEVGEPLCSLRCRGKPGELNIVLHPSYLDV